MRTTSSQPQAAAAWIAAFPPVIWSLSAPKPSSTWTSWAWPSSAAFIRGVDDWSAPVGTPASSSKRATSTWPWPTASSKALRPEAGSPLASSSTRTTSRWPYLAARASGGIEVAWFLEAFSNEFSFALVSAPDSSNNLTHSKWPKRAAACNAVSPTLFLWSGYKGKDKVSQLPSSCLPNMSSSALCPAYHHKKVVAIQAGQNLVPRNPHPNTPCGLSRWTVGGSEKRQCVRPITASASSLICQSKILLEILQGSPLCLQK